MVKTELILGNQGLTGMWVDLFWHSKDHFLGCSCSNLWACFCFYLQLFLPLVFCTLCTKYWIQRSYTQGVQSLGESDAPEENGTMHARGLCLEEPARPHEGGDSERRLGELKEYYPCAKMGERVRRDFSKHKGYCAKICLFERPYCG